MVRKLFPIVCRYRVNNILEGLEQVDRSLGNSRCTFAVNLRRDRQLCDPLDDSHQRAAMTFTERMCRSLNL